MCSVSKNRKWVKFCDLNWFLTENAIVCRVSMLHCAL